MTGVLQDARAEVRSSPSTPSTSTSDVLEGIEAAEDVVQESVAEDGVLVDGLFVDNARVEPVRRRTFLDESRTRA